jgi:hypothetical protein
VTNTPDIGVADVADFLLTRAADQTLAVGPLLWQPTDGTVARLWYFLVGSGDSAKQFHCTRVTVNDRTDRQALLAELASRRVPLVVHLFNDELAMARVCEALWPGESISRTRSAIEAAENVRQKAVSELQGT